MRKMKKVSLLGLSLILAFSLMACNKDDKKVKEEVVEKEVEEIEEVDLEPEGENIEKEVHFDSLEQRVERSTYISRLILIELEDGKEELKLLEDVKGSLSPEDVSRLEGMEKDVEYLVFLRKVEELVDLTDNKSLIPFKESGQETLDEVHKILDNN